MQTPVEFGGPMGYLAVFAIAAALSWVLTPAMRRIALRRGALDDPDGGRKTQISAVPYLGGLAIAGSVSLVLLAATVLRGSPSTDLPLLLGVLVPALILAVVGLADDLRGLAPAPRFLAQTVAAVVTTGFLVGAGTGAQLSALTLVNYVITLLWIVGITNALNLLDNMDGAASGTAASAALALFAMAALNGQFLVAALALVLAGACVGFLRWNRHPASIYMGDSGSLFIGFLLAAIAIRINLRNLPPTQALLAPAIVLAVPVLDTTLVVVSRIRRGVSPFQGGLDHLSHRWRRTGLEVRAVAWRMWILTAGFGAFGVLATRMSAAWASVLLTVCGVVFCLVLVHAFRLPETGDLS